VAGLEKSYTGRYLGRFLGNNLNCLCRGSYSHPYVEGNSVIQPFEPISLIYDFSITK